MSFLQYHHPVWGSGCAAGVALDLQEENWSDKLIASGFSPKQPTAWVLEGLLYYLQPDTVPSMLKCEFCQDLYAALSDQVSNTHQINAILCALRVCSQEAARVSARGSTLVASIVDADFVENLKKQDTFKDKQSLMSAWKWGCPGDPALYFGKCGWQVLSSATWIEAAHSYGHATAETGASRTGSSAPQEGPAAKTSNVRFVTAVLAA
eukprot:357733-Chlamydomonas_euryale.AAC.8